MNVRTSSLEVVERLAHESPLFNVESWGSKWSCDTGSCDELPAPWFDRRRARIAALVSSISRPEDGLKSFEIRRLALVGVATAFPLEPVRFKESRPSVNGKIVSGLAAKLDSSLLPSSKVSSTDSESTNGQPVLGWPARGLWHLEQAGGLRVGVPVGVPEPAFPIARFGVPVVERVVTILVVGEPVAELAVERVVRTGESAETSADLAALGMVGVKSGCVEVRLRSRANLARCG